MYGYFPDRLNCFESILEKPNLGVYNVFGLVVLMFLHKFQYRNS